MVSRLDDHFGEVMALRKDCGLHDETIVFFTSHNGPQGDQKTGGTPTRWIERNDPERVAAVEPYDHETDPQENRSAGERRSPLTEWSLETDYVARLQ